MSRSSIRGLYAIADTGLIATGRLAAMVERVLRGGAALIQYRHKGSLDAAGMEALRAVRDACRAFGVPLLINDDVSLARVIDADGVHLGRDDGTIADARAALGTARIIGASCYNDLRIARRARDQGADYLAFGSFYQSAIKRDAVRAAPELLTRARRETDLPLVAIGGITPGNGAALITAGADALAVISGVFAQTDPGAAARQYARLFAPLVPGTDSNQREDQT